MKKTSLKIYFSYLLLFLVIALTGFEFFFRDNKLIYFLLFPISTISFVYFKHKINPKAIVFILGIVCIVLSHSIMYGLPYTFALTAFIRFLTYYFIASLLGFDFRFKFVNIIYFLSFISLIFHTGINVSNLFYDLLLNISKNITPLSFDLNNIESWTNPNQTLILFTIPQNYIFKNNGPFWEPGMFAVFINIALAINIIETKNIWHKKNIVLIAASATSLSASSLISTVFIISYYLLFIKKTKYSLFHILIIPIFAAPIYNSEYVKGKIESNIETMDKSYSRFGAMIVHWEQIKTAPLIGKGLYAVKEQENMLGIKMVSPNGVTNIVRYYGIPMGVSMLILLFFTSRKILSDNRNHTIILFITLLIVSFSQDVTTRHFYYVLYFFPFIVNKSTKYYEI